MKNVLFTELDIDFASPLPVYEQIKGSIKRAIARNIVSEEQTLPSIRELASFLKINPNTVARAYRELMQEKIINGRPGVGFWMEKSGRMALDKSGLLREEFKKFVEKAVEMGFSQQQIRELIDGYFPEGSTR